MLNDGSSLVMTKGKYSVLELLRGPTTSRFAYSVMSGLITSPHFIKFFNAPDSLQLGSMVAVLEVGAFSMGLLSLACFRLLIGYSSHISRCGSSR